MHVVDARASRFSLAPENLGVEVSQHSPANSGDKYILEAAATPKQRVFHHIAHLSITIPLTLLPCSVLRLDSLKRSKRDSFVPATPDCVCAILGRWQIWPTRRC